MLTWLSELPGAFHLFRYLTFRTLGAAGTGLFLVFFFGPAIISALRKTKYIGTSSIYRT